MMSYAPVFLAIDKPRQTSQHAPRVKQSYLAASHHGHHSLRLS